MKTKVNTLVFWSVMLFLGSFLMTSCGSFKKMANDPDAVRYEVKPEVLETHAGQIEFSLEGVLKPGYFDRKAVVRLAPEMKYGGQVLKLEPFYLIGEKVEGPGTKIGKKSGGKFTYSATFAYKPEMNASELVVTPVVYRAKDAGGVELTEEKVKEMIANKRAYAYKEVKLADGVICTATKIKHDEIFLMREDNYETETLVEKSAPIYFLINRHNLNWNLPLNKADEAKASVNEMLDFIQLGWEIRNITIDGWASPDGEEIFNDKLSEQRAEAAQKYLLKKFKKWSKKKDNNISFDDAATEISWNVSGRGPDWTDFTTNIKKSNLEDKSVILNVIKMSDPVKREEEIHNMIDIYPELADDILPPLRRAYITVTCVKPKKTDEEIAVLAATNPDSLDYKELMHAAELTDDAAAKLAIYETASRQFPEEWGGFNNAAVLMIDLDQLPKAESYLQKADALSPKNGVIINNQGVLAAHQDNWHAAKVAFAKAVEFGENVDHNLGIVAILDAKYSDANTKLAASACTYNLALAQLMSGNNAEAEATLKCAKEKGHEEYYLLAVVGARTDNQAMVIENLTEALKLNPDRKAEAAEDREFVKFFEVDEFKNIVE